MPGAFVLAPKETDATGHRLPRDWFYSVCVSSPPPPHAWAPYNQGSLGSTELALVPQFHLRAENSPRGFRSLRK